MIKHFRTAVAAALFVGVGVSAQAGLTTVTTTFFSPDLSTEKCSVMSSVDNGIEFDGTADCEPDLGFTLDIVGSEILVRADNQFGLGDFEGFVIEVDQPAGTVFATAVLDLEAFNFVGEPAVTIVDGRLKLNFADLLWASVEEEGRGIANFTFTTTTNSVPEPASLGLVGLAFATLGMAGRRRRRA